MIQTANLRRFYLTPNVFICACYTFIILFHPRVMKQRTHRSMIYHDFYI